jgi:hypothetical protein
VSVAKRPNVLFQKRRPTLSLMLHQTIQGQLHKHKVISSLIQPVQVILFFISFCLLRTSVCSHERRYSGWSRHQMVWVPTIIESQNVCSNLSKSLPSHCKDYKRISYYHGSKFWSRQTVKDSSGSGR